jgi:hypothetical protein
MLQQLSIPCPIFWAWPNCSYPEPNISLFSALPVLRFPLFFRLPLDFPRWLPSRAIFLERVVCPGGHLGHIHSPRVGGDGARRALPPCFVPISHQTTIGDGACPAVPPATSSPREATRCCPPAPIGGRRDKPDLQLALLRVSCGSSGHQLFCFDKM